jgi:hypothetical protein
MSDQPQDVQAMVQRIDALERQNRWLIRAGLIGSLVAVAIVTMGQTRTSRTVEAERFVLRDTVGRMRGRLVMEEEGPALRLYDSDGAPELTIGVDSKSGYGPYLLMSNVNTKLDSKAKVELHLTTAGAPSLTLRDEAWHYAVLGTSDLVVTRTGEQRTTSAASLKLYDKDGKIIWSAP